MLIEQTLALTHAPLEDSLRMRLLLFLYCHITEMHDLYNIVGNLLRVSQGERYTISPFVGTLHSSGNNASYPSSKVERINEWSQLVGISQLGEMFCDMIVKEVRNAFFPF